MVKSFLTASLVAVGTVIAAFPAHGISLTTTFVAGNSNRGAMFDATTFSNSLTVTGIEINSTSSSFSGSDTIAVYTKSGTYVGSETNSSAWTLVSQSLVSALNPLGTPSFIDVTDFILPSSSVTGIYVTFTGGNSFTYTNGTNTYSNADLRLDLGVGKGSLFGTTIPSRTWNGSIIYNDPNPTPVPFDFDPSVGLLALGGLYSVRRWVKNKKVKS